MLWRLCSKLHGHSPLVSEASWVKWHRPDRSCFLRAFLFVGVISPTLHSQSDSSNENFTVFVATYINNVFELFPSQGVNRTLSMTNIYSVTPGTHFYNCLAVLENLSHVLSWFKVSLVTSLLILATSPPQHVWFWRVLLLFISFLEITFV